MFLFDSEKNYYIVHESVQYNLLFISPKTTENYLFWTFRFIKAFWNFGVCVCVCLNCRFWLKASEKITQNCYVKHSKCHETFYFYFYLKCKWFFNICVWSKAPAMFQSTPWYRILKSELHELKFIFIIFFSKLIIS